MCKCVEMNKENLSVSEQAKHQLADALKTRMIQKPLDRITISELTTLCKIRRQNFYYHFENIFLLLMWRC